VTRIISGRAGGHRIETPTGSGTRPTSDRVREALFSRLEHLDVLVDADVLDLYAGSGALGLEAASRGARSALLVESDRGAAAVARRNVAALGLPGVVVRQAPVAKVLAVGAARPCSLVFADPPYELSEDALAADLVLLDEHGWLTADALVVVERSARAPQPRWPAGWELEAERRYGETAIWFAGPLHPEGVA
jgi:16S rRNA (guanine966-N2)-methyltransferase